MSRMPWFRVDTDLVDHPKVDRLADLLNEPLAGWYVMRMWAWVARFASRGRLSDVARPSLERSCGWRGEPGRLVSALVEAGLLDAIEADEDGCTLEVHDWWEKQGAIVSKAENDRERLRKQRADRGSKKPAVEPSSSERRETVARPSSERRGSVAGDVTERDGTLKDMSSKLDDPQPRLELVTKPTAEPVPVEALEDKLTEAEFQVFEHWRVKLNHPRAKPTPERRRILAKALKTYTVAELHAAIDGCAVTPWNMGQNPDGKVHDDLELILRDAKHIEGFARAVAP